MDDLTLAGYCACRTCLKPVRVLPPAPVGAA